jgi:SAM-dependent methyltransferase
MEERFRSSRLARSFGRVAAEYDRGRLDWPLEVVDQATRELALGPDADVVDLAAGTGKLTRRLRDRFTRVVAVEPDAAMRALLERSTPGVAAYSGTAEEIPLPDASADAVFVADAFHWFEGGAALREIARVLRPAGALVLLWNDWRGRHFEPPLPETVVDRLRGVYVRADYPRGSRYLSGEWQEAFAGSPFAPLQHQKFEHDVVLSTEDVVLLWLSVSSVASLPDAERDELATELRSVLAGTYRLPLTTDLYWTRIGQP